MQEWRSDNLEDDVTPSAGSGGGTIDNNLSTRQTLLLIGLAGLVALLVSSVPVLNLIGYPFRLLTTIVHELGHGLAALGTGGEFISFQISPNGAGLAYTRGGLRFVVIQAGYLSAAAFGAGLILLGRNHRHARAAMGLIGVAMILLSLCYGLPTMFELRMLAVLVTTLFSGVLLGALFVWVALRASPGWIIFLLHLTAIQTGLTAFFDLLALITFSTRLFDTQTNDAQSMAGLTLIPAIVWALLWAVMALALLGGAVWVTWLRRPA
jgi:hypothetical protein